MKKLFVVLLCTLVAASAWAAGGKVVVYSAHEETIINALVPLFEKETGIKLEVVKMGSGDIIKRAKAELANPQADVIWSIGGEQLEAENAILAPYTPKDWDKIANVYKVGTNWLPYTGIMNVFVVNTKMLTPDKYPKTWKDLTEARFKNNVCSAAADKSGSSYMQLANVLKVYGESEGWDVYKNIMKNMWISASSGGVPKFVNDGERSVGLTLEDNAFRYVQAGGPVAIVYPVDGTVAAPDGIALLKGAPNLANAKTFIDWCLSKPTQEVLVEKMNRRPVRTDAKNPKGLPDLSTIKTVAYDFKWAAENNKAFVKKFVDLKMDLGL